MKRKFLLGGLALLSIAMACSPSPIRSSSVNVRPQNGANLNVQVPVGSGVKFSATDESGKALDVNWDVVEGSSRGAIDASGNYTAPNNIPSPPTATIRATTKAVPPQSGTFVVSIIPAGEIGISGTVTLPAGLLDAPRAEPMSAFASTQAALSFKPDWNARRVRGEIIVVPRDGGARTQEIAGASSLRTAQVRDNGDSLSVSVPAGVSDEAFAKQVASETGAIVQPNYIYSPASLPNDPELGRQPNLVQIDAPGAWNVQTAVNDNLIAVLDTGLAKNQPEIQGRFTEGKDFCAALKDPETDKASCSGEDDNVTDIPTNQGGNGHGTFIAGQIAAVTGNGKGIAGLTQSGKILIVKIFAADSQGPLADSSALSKGINYAVDRGARVLNLSLGVCSEDTARFDIPDQIVAKALQRARDLGAVIVAAAGNNGNNGGGACDNSSVQFPGNNPNVIAVASVSSNNARSSFSAVGSQVSISAPGERIVSLAQTDALDTKDGTSFAAPQVSAVVGLMLSKNSSLQTSNGNTLPTVKGILESTAKPLGARDQFGAGLLQAGAALAKATPGDNTVKTTVYMYADPLENGVYNGNSQNAGRAVFTLSGTSGTLTYNIVTTRALQPLKPGTYRITACVNKNNNDRACDKGDLGGAVDNVQYTGTKLTVSTPIQLVVRQTD